MNFIIHVSDHSTNKLSNNKSSGNDLILNEYLKASNHDLKVIITNLFNLVLASGKVPHSWSLGTISPIYKGKRDVNGVDNYRGITILSCFGKLFTSILNDRIYSFLDKNNLLGWEQGGYRKYCGTSDQVFTLHCLIDVYLKRKKRLLCTFIDYKKAFDLVQRNVLWDKLLSNGISGKILEVIKDLYAKAKSCVKTQTGVSASVFSCNVGLRQGENLSPILFSLFLNDLKHYFIQNNISGLSVMAQVASDLNFDDIETFLHLFLLLYADDTTLLAETEKDMQKSLDCLKDYCDISGLSINVEKTKVVVFSRGKIRNLPCLTFNGSNLQCVFEYKYLGTLFNYNNRFQKTIKAQCVSAKRALFSLMRKCRSLDLPIDLQIELFDRCVVPIMLYNCEVWGHEQLEQLDKLQLKFFKLLLGVKRSTPSCMVYGELGQIPVSLIAKSRLLSFWYKLCLDSRSNINKYSTIMLQLNQRLLDSLGFHNDLNLQWLKYVCTSLDNLGLTYIWQNHNTIALSLAQFKKIVKTRIRDQYIQNWQSQIFENNTCMTYRAFKSEFCFKNYLTLLNPKLRKLLTNFRLSSSKLPIEKLRYTGIQRSDRHCTLCDKNEVGDEFHYLFICQNDQIKNKRKEFLPRHYCKHPNMYKLHNLLNVKTRKKLTNLAKFISETLDNLN